MKDERLSEFGNDRVRELTALETDQRERIFDKIRYYAVLGLMLIQLGAGLGLIVGVPLLLYTQSLDVLSQIGLSLALFAGAVGIR